MQYNWQGIATAVTDAQYKSPWVLFTKRVMNMPQIVLRCKPTLTRHTSSILYGACVRNGPMGNLVTTQKNEHKNVATWQHAVRRHSVQVSHPFGPRLDLTPRGTNSSLTTRPQSDYIYGRAWTCGAVNEPRMKSSRGTRPHEQLIL